MNDQPEISVGGQGNIVGGERVGFRDIINNNYGGAAPRNQASGPPSRLADLRFSPLREKFAGRKTLLADLEKMLLPGQATSLSQRAALHADGGVGKTALAVELAWRLFDSGKFDYAFLLDASSSETIDNGLAALCARDLLNLPEQEAKEPKVRLEGVRRWLKSPVNAQRTLLLLDNADSDDARKAVRELHRTVPACAMLITSRKHVGDGIKEVELELFNEQEAREFLRTHIDAALLPGANTDATLDAIAQAVDYLPLALEIVASYLRENHIRTEAWLSEWQHTPAPTLRYHNSDDIQYPVSLSRVWEQSVQKLSANARELLAALAWFAPRPAGFPIQTLEAQDSWKETRGWFIELEKASLIQWSMDADEVTIHRVLQAVIRDGMSDTDEESSQKVGVAILTSMLPDARWNEAGWRVWERLLPHLEAILAPVRNRDAEKPAARIISRLGVWFHYRAQYVEAEPLFRRALEIDEKSFGKDHPEVAIRLNNLAELLRATNRLAEAESLFRRALEITEKSFGKDHPTVAIGLNNLAGLLQDTNRLADAEPLCRRGLKIFQRFAALTGYNHPHHVTTLNNYTGLLKKLGWPLDKVVEDLEKVKKEARVEVEREKSASRGEG